ncbi:hypothetical protein MBRU_17965 [Mycolicibacterium brumae DSM 44177]|nr:hypothetical protein MBRU_17965 [Mycolicibacterium brumae DSM 44177]
MDWQLRRGLLDPATGSPWWRAANAALLRDSWEARELAMAGQGDPSTPSVAATVEFIRHPSAPRWYRAHNLSIVSAYLVQRDLAGSEGRVERFFLNLVLMRVLYAHALVAAPKLALSWLAPAARPLGDPRLGMTAIFLSLSRILPHRYPVGDNVEEYVLSENSFGHLLDVGVISPRLPQLYEWAASDLETPELRTLLDDGIPAYSWDPNDHDVWTPTPSALARLARRVVPAHHRSL